MADLPAVTPEHAVVTFAPTSPVDRVRPEVSGVIVTHEGHVIITHNGVGHGARLTPDQMVAIALILGNLGARKIRAEDAFTAPVAVAFPEVAGHA